MGIYLKTIKIPKPTAEMQNRFPFSLPLYKNGIDFDFNKPVTIFSGENASGKSTPLESLAVACEFPRQGGTVSNMGRKT